MAAKHGKGSARRLADRNQPGNKAEGPGLSEPGPSFCLRSAAVTGQTLLGWTAPRGPAGFCYITDRTTPPSTNMVAPVT